LLGSLCFDFRYAVRQLRNAPTFSLAVILTMALAIGANTAIFSVVDSVLLCALPFQGSDKLLCVWHGDGQSYTWYTFSFPRFTYFQENLKQLADLAAYDDEVVTLRDKTGPVRLEGGRVSANFFSLLGVRPQLGRSFRPDEDRHGASAVILLSARLWRLRFNADPGVVGTPLVIDGESSTVIGVLPEGFQFTDSAVDVWRSRIVDTRTFAPTGVRLGSSYLTVVARLRANTSLLAVQARLKLFNSQYPQQYPGNSDIVGPVSAFYLQDKLFANVHLMLMVLWGAVICLLVIACSNVANLVMTRATSRYREISVRFALGANRLRVAAQLIMDGLVLSFASLLVSFPLTLWGTRLLVFALSQNSSVMPPVGLNMGVMLFTFGLASGIGVLLGLAPMWMLTGRSAEGRSATASRFSKGFRSALVAAQFALCLVLLASAGLLTSSFVRMNSMNTGLHVNDVLMMSLDLMPQRYDDWQKRLQFYDQVLRRVQMIPGVHGAAVASRVDLVGSGLEYVVHVEGQPDVGASNPSASRIQLCLPAL
jgi:predicted permease